MKKSTRSEMMQLIDATWFMRRDIVSSGYDEALRYISKLIPLKIHKIPSGTKCWTWVVPEKWKIHKGFIDDINGKRILDVKEHPLHIVSYSLPVDKIVTRAELFRHIHTNPRRPHAIPFEFKYYERDWGFCVQHSRLKKFNQKKYRVFIDSEFTKGSLKVGDCTIKGEVDDTIVLVAHLCHPAMVNDDLAGVAVLIDIAKQLRARKNHYTYKILLVPETIGSIAYLSQNEQIIPKLKCGLFFEMLGSNGSHALQLSRQGNTRLDRIARHVMSKRFKKSRVGAFRTIVGNDELVFNGPGVDIPMISISRYPYPEYHTSDDNPSIISEKKLIESREFVLEILGILDRDFVPVRKFKGPIFLSGYDLWIDWRVNDRMNANLDRIMCCLEGDQSAFDISEKLNLEFVVVLDFLDKLYKKKLISKKQ